MRWREAGFTTLELVIAVAITIVLLAAGGVWMLSMQPGALRAAVNDVDADFAAAQSIAESSGNGATLVFAPQAGGVPGFTVRVYSGRPDAVNAVTPTTTMAVTSASTVSEAHFGKPPFAIFLNSAGYATGTGGYPTLDAHENPTFPVIAQQPACPSGGIVLTFTSPQGATATRTFACNTMVAGSAAADPTPTPNAPHVSPTYLLAHDTTDSGPLRFKAAEYGYYHWYASTTSGAPCQTIASDTGAAPAAFASPWPYAAASPASESAASPAPPQFAPYTWPAGDPNDPPAWFALSPVLHNGGMCTVTVADDYGQSGAVTVQVMGDLTASTNTATLTVGKGTQTIGFSKTFDSEKLLLSAGGPCLGIVSVAIAAGSYPSSPSHTPATASVTISPVAAGTCTLVVQDQYGEQIGIGITVKSSPFATWPASLVVGANGDAVGVTSGTLAEANAPVIARVAPILNALLGGATARAASAVPCYALAENISGTGVDSTLPMQVSQALGIYVDTNFCIVDASDTPITEGEMVAYEPVGSGQTGTFQPTANTCSGSGYATFGTWTPNLGRDEAQASLSAIANEAGSCTVDLSDGNSTQAPAPDSGAVTVNVLGRISETTTETQHELGCGIGGETSVTTLTTVGQLIEANAGLTYSYNPPGWQGSDESSGAWGPPYSETQLEALNPNTPVSWTAVTNVVMVAPPGPENGC